MAKVPKTKNVKEEKEVIKYNVWQNSIFMVKCAWQHQKSVLLLCLALILLAVGSSLLQLFVTPTILGAIEAHVSLPALLTTIAMFTLGLVAVNGLKEYANTNTMFGRVALRMELLLRVNQKIATTSFPNLEDSKSQKLLERAQDALGGNRSAGEVVWETLTLLLQSVLGFVIYLLLLSVADPVIVLVTIATTAGGFFLTAYINNWGWRHHEIEDEYSRKMEYIRHTEQDYTIAKDIRLFGMGNWLRDVYARVFGLYKLHAIRREKVYIWANIIDALLALLRNGIAYGYLIAMTLQGGLSAAEFLLLFTAFGGLTTWLTQIMDQYRTLRRNSSDLSFLREFLEYPEPFRFENGESLEPDNNKEYEIRLQNVSFRYPGAEQDTIHNMSLTIRPGEKLAVVGLNGAGKTTLIKLICGFYDPTEGAVLLNGQDIRKYNRRDIYRHFSAVFQTFSLLDVTVAENVAQTAESIDEDKVKAVLGKAGLDERIDSMPNGLQTHLGRDVYEDGVQLSGGEKQRLMLARALYKDAPIIVLDEPTAALDPIAESDIYGKYNSMTAGRTSIYISHRLASTRFCDRVLLLENGQILEEGTHESLLQKGGRYAELFEIQSRYYQEGGDLNGEAEESAEGAC